MRTHSIALVVSLLWASTASAGGIKLVDLGGNEGGHALVATSDGGVVIGGVGPDVTSGGFTLAKLTPEGQVDLAFGTGGAVILQISDSGHLSQVNDVVETEGGDLVAVGMASMGEYPDTALAGVVVVYDAGGTELNRRVINQLDDGIQVTAFAAVAVDAAGRIIVVGQAGNGFAVNTLVVRFEPGLELDETFGVHGMVELDLACVPLDWECGTAVALRDDEKIIIGSTAAGCTTGDQDFVVSAVTVDGTLDTSFGAGGATTIDLGGTESLNDLKLTDDGGVVALGTWFFRDPSTGRIVQARPQLARLKYTGELDVDFGFGGAIRQDFGKQWAAVRYGEGLLLEPDGRIVVAGWRGDPVSSRGDGYIGRLEANGRDVDTSFGGTGLHEEHVGGLESLHVVRDVVGSPAGYTTAGSLTPDTTAYDLVMDMIAMRLKSDGTLDATFGP